MCNFALIHLPDNLGYFTITNESYSVGKAFLSNKIMSECNIVAQCLTFLIHLKFVASTQFGVSSGFSQLHGSRLAFRQKDNESLYLNSRLGALK